RDGATPIATMARRRSGGWGEARCCCRRRKYLRLDLIQHRSDRKPTIFSSETKSERRAHFNKRSVCIQQLFLEKFSMRLGESELDTIAARTIADYNRNADAFREGTQD